MDCVWMLVENMGVRVDAFREHGETLLHMTVRARQLTILEYLVEKCDSVNVVPTENECKSPLCCAVESEQAQAVWLLIHGNVIWPQDKSEHEKAPLFVVCRTGDDEMLDVLLKDNHRCVPQRLVTALNIAESMGHQGIVS